MTTRGLMLLLVLAVVAGCRHTEVKADDGAGGGAADAGAPATHAVLGGGGHSPLAGLAGHVLPPSEPGQSRSAILGCAATPGSQTEETRALLPEEKVEATPMSTGLVLSHEVPHACCLSAKTTAVVDGLKVSITETLSGTPCRCRCSSTLRTAVGLAKGSYAVEVKTIEPGRERTAWTGAIEVK